MLPVPLDGHLTCIAGLDFGRFMERKFLNNLMNPFGRNGSSKSFFGWKALYLDHIFLFVHMYIRHI